MYNKMKVLFLLAALASVSSVQLGLGSYATNGILYTKVATVAPAKSATPEIPAHAAPAKPQEKKETIPNPTSYASITQHITHEAPVAHVATPIVEVAPAVHAAPIVKVIPAVHAAPVVEVDPIAHVAPVAQVLYKAPIVQVPPITRVLPVVHAAPVVHSTHAAPIKQVNAAPDVAKEKYPKPSSYSSVTNHFIHETLATVPAPAVDAAPVVHASHAAPIKQVNAAQDAAKETYSKPSSYSSATNHFAHEALATAPITHTAPAPVVDAAPVYNKAPIVESEAKIAHHEEYADAHPHYIFDYGVKDTHTHDIKNQHEERDGDFVKGFYTFKQPDGVIRIVHYNADHKNGFNAHVEYKGHAVHPVVEHKEDKH